MGLARMRDAWLLLAAIKANIAGEAITDHWYLHLCDHASACKPYMDHRCLRGSMQFPRGSRC